MDVCKYLIKCSELTFDDLLLINKKNILTVKNLLKWKCQKLIYIKFQKMN